jgi:preprotein translocase subunit YajC
MSRGRAMYFLLTKSGEKEGGKREKRVSEVEKGDSDMI